jgi:N-acetylglucosamine kinase-like BadF-type ATPase
VCGWAGSLGGADGINVISGTGSMTYGERAGVGARVGGWGELIGDEGSGYWIGVRALRAFSQMSDGRRPPGPLADVLRERLELIEDVDLIDLVNHQWRADRAKVAALSRLVVEAARRGDGDAAGILADAGAELARLVDATRRRLDYAADEPVPVSYSGGVFGADEVREAFASALAAAPEDYRLQPPLYPPVIGAALYAAKLAGEPLDDAARVALAESAHVRAK